MPNVLHVCATYYPALAYGGPIVSLHALVKAQRDCGATVRVLTTDANGVARLPAGTRDVDGVIVSYSRTVPLNRYGVSPGLFADIVRIVPQSDVVHVHGTSLPSTTVALWLAAASRVPVVLTPRGSLMAWARAQKSTRKRLYGLLDSLPLRSAIIHVTSDAEGEDARALGLGQVVVIPNGVDAERFAGATNVPLRARLGIDPGLPIIAWLGRFDPVKNLEVLIEASEHIDAALVLAGDWNTPYGRKMRDMVAARGRSRVYFPGPVEGELKAALLQEASVYAHPSHMESYGMAIAEALAAGCPVVASTGTPWQEVEIAGAGRWVRAAPDAFAGALADVLARDPGPVRVIARTVASRHDWHSRAQALLEVYQAAMDRRRPPGLLDT